MKVIDLTNQKFGKLLVLRRGENLPNGGPNKPFCGDPPVIQFKARGHKQNVEPYVYNGIDRVNNDIGYLIENCVSCCKVCNFMKRSMSKNDFINHVNKIAMRRVAQ